ncbi:MAG: phosphoenolpyruvate--protein phosphotransferase [Desulfobacterales bacterium]|nr:phosphoenolpyruvate--protein phosphotransferase [Desulfobacterales bacterium]
MYLQKEIQKEIRLKGITGSPGYCVGESYILDKEHIELIDQYYIEDNKVNSELNRFNYAVQRAKNELKTIIQNITEELKEHISILEGHILLLHDKMLYGRVIDLIEKEKINAEWALKKVLSEIKSNFSSMADLYLQGRLNDILHVTGRIIRNLSGAEEVNISKIDKKVILIANDLSPAETCQMKLSKIIGFVINRGGKASHTSIVAKTLGIPSVLGLGNITDLIGNDDLVIVDGFDGIVIINPSEETVTAYRKKIKEYDDYKISITKGSKIPAETLDGIKIRIMGNIELPEEVSSVKNYGGDGIGLVRTEFAYLRRDTFPTEEELFKEYKDIAEAMFPFPVYIRTLDINGEKEIPYISGTKEGNPALGLRAIRFCLKRKDIFKTQLRAILRASFFGNISIIFPMISSYEELFEAKKILNDASKSLQTQQIPHNQKIKIGIMIEVPSAAILAESMIHLIDFFSIGTNDLTQYTLAIDRSNTEVAYIFHPLHPAVIRMVKHVVDVAKKYGKPVSMCGEMAGDIMYLPVLLGLGIDELSMSPQSIPDVKKAIQQINTCDLSPLVKEIFKLNTTNEIINFLSNNTQKLSNSK